jgi:uncharacterized protein (DUF305 family)
MTIRGAAVAATIVIIASFSIRHFATSQAAAGAGSQVATLFPRLCGQPTGRLADSAFLAQLHVSMTRMMAGMDARPAGNVDTDFVSTMVPHHQGAIDMAEAELTSGTNPQLRRIAQEIIVDQQQEITAMRLALGEPLPPSMPSPDQTPRGSGT